MEEVVLSGVAANSLELRARSPPLGLLQAATGVRKHLCGYQLAGSLCAAS